MKIHPSSFPWLAIGLIGLAAVAGSCGGGSTATPSSPAPPATTVPSQPPPSTPASADPKCGALPPGPVTRYAISPREQRTDGEIVDMRVRALPNFDEAWCLDKDRSHRLDFNSNQRNAAGRECCWINEPRWTIPEDPEGIVASHASIDANGFIHRVNVEPAGRESFFTIESELDGIRSNPWQSGSGYRREPLKVLTMAAADIPRDCKCIFRGNGQYEGTGCNK